MDYPRGWTFPTCDEYESNTSSNPFSVNISSLFRRPSKVTKSGSRNTSPRHNVRKRTNSTVPVARTRSVLEKQVSSTPRYTISQRHARPLSWHPNTYLDFNIPQQDYLELPVENQYQQRTQYTTTEVNGLVTPMSYPIMDEPQIQELITPLAELSAQENDSTYNNGYDDNQYWCQSGLPKQQQYTMDVMFQQNTQFQQNWGWNSQVGPSVQTAPSSPAFLPMQGGVEASPLSLNTHKEPTDTEGEELVGMGLYDSPAEVQSSSMLFSSISPVNGVRRSLKLEDSFEPASESSDAEHDPDVEDNEDGFIEDTVEEARSHHNNIPVYIEPHYPTAIPDVTNQSFFFEQDENGIMPYIPAMTYMNMNNAAYATAYNTAYPMYGWI